MKAEELKRNMKTGYDGLEQAWKYPELKHVDEDLISQWEVSFGSDPDNWNVPNLLNVQLCRRLEQLNGKALHQTVHSVDSTNWLSIEFAPRDGTDVLAWNAFAKGSPYPHGKVCVAYWDVNHTQSWTGSVCETTHLRLTHWMPLPPPPKADFLETNT